MQQLELGSAAVSDCAGFAPGLEDLAEVLPRKYDRESLLRSVQSGVPHVEQIVAEREVWPMFFHDAKRQQTRALRAPDCLTELGGGQRLPVNGPAAWRCG